jgi:exopolysaccharide production protein ExoZ
MASGETPPQMNPDLLGPPAALASEPGKPSLIETDEAPSRAPAGANRIVSLQILRFFAAAMVATLHTRILYSTVNGHGGGGGFYNFLMIGDSGIDIFFVLSGFVIMITGPLANRRPTATQFFWQRWRRVVPIYFLISVIVILAALRRAPVDESRIVATFIFWPYAKGIPVYPYLDPGWTLCFEMAFYSAVSFVLIGGKLKRNIVLISVLLIGFIATGRLNVLFFEFGLGVALALNRDFVSRLGAGKGGFLLVLGIGVLIAQTLRGLEGIDDPLRLMAGQNTAWHVMTFGFPAALIVAGCLALEPLAKGRLAGLLAALGDASYSIYLVNEVAEDLSVKIFRWAHLGGNILLTTSIGLAVAVLLGVTIYRFIEKPMLNILKRVNFYRLNSILKVV